MKRYRMLLETIGSDLSIKQGNNEPIQQYQMRLIYSAVGRLMLASMYDHIEPEQEQPNTESVSVVHLKKKGKDILSSYTRIYSEYAGSFDIERIIDYIYDVFSASGQMYHTAYYVSPATYRMAANNHVALYRGLSLNIPIHMSGLGVWNPINEPDSPESIRDMFCLSEQTLAEQWKTLLSTASWGAAELLDGMQFMNTHHFRHGYWTDQPEQNDQISVARIGMQGTEIYYLYRMDNDSLYLAQIPSWMTEEGGQYNFMNACLFSSERLPQIRVQLDGSIVYLKTDYILPPAENTLLQLYSWPASYTNIPDHFSRIMCGEVYQALKPVYETIGFQFQEEML